MDSDKDLPTSTPASSTSSSSTTTDVSAHRSCVRCTRRMSSVKYDCERRVFIFVLVLSAFSLEAP